MNNKKALQLCKQSRRLFGHSIDKPLFNISGKLNINGRRFSVSNIVDKDLVPPYSEFNFNTLAELQQKACALYAKNPMLGTKVGSSYEWITYAEFGLQVEKFRGVLCNLGIGKNDKVAIISNNRTEWAVAMYATVSLGAQFVPMYEAQLEKDWNYIISDSGTKLLIVSNENIHSKVKSFKGQVQSIIVLDCDVKEEYSFHRMINDPSIPLVKDAVEGLHEDDIDTSKNY